MILSAALMIIALAIGSSLAASRPRAFTLFLLPSGIFAFGAEADNLGGLANLSAVWLFLLILLCLVVMIRIGSGGVRLSAPEICYLVFLAWCALECWRAQYFEYAARAFLKLLFPFLSMYLARRTLGDPRAAERFVHAQFWATSAAGVVFWIAWVFPIYELIGGLLWSGAAYFDHAAIVAMLALACWRVRRKAGFALLAIFLAVICFRAVNRTTLMALAVGLSVFCALEFRRLAVVLLPAFYVGVGSILLLVPSFREKMFYQPDRAETGALLTTDVVASGDFNDNGRFTMWRRVLDQFFWPNPVMGSGLGSTQAWFYTGAAQEAGCGTIKIEHSEYVKLASDTGLVGVTLFVLVLVLCVFTSGAAYRRARGDDGLSRTFALAALCAVPVFAVCMATDNALLYVLPAAQFPLAFGAVADALSSSSEAGRSSPARRAARAPVATVRWLPRRPAGARATSVMPSL